MTIKNRRVVEARVGELREQGLTMRAIAAEVGVSLGSVYNILRQLEAAGELEVSVDGAHRYVKQAREEGALGT